MLFQNAQCPICSWIHKKDGRPPSTFHHFEVKKAAKGIVYYADRVRELRGNPTLAHFHSPHKTAVAVVEAKVALKAETGGAGVGGDIAMEVKTTRKTVSKSGTRVSEKGQKSDIGRVAEKVGIKRKAVEGVGTGGGVGCAYDQASENGTNKRGRRRKD